MIKRILLAVCIVHVAWAGDLEQDFAAPPDAARPWVYWLFQDGNLSREGMTADLEAMKQAGIGGVIMMEVDVGVPRGPVKFMSEPWRELIKHAVAEADRLGLEVALAAGPGWCGTGGPWVKPEQAMQHLVGAETNVTGPVRFDAVLPQPKPRTPFFGAQTLTPELRKQWQEFYRDEVVVAFPTPTNDYRLRDADEKALYFRPPFTSQRGVKPFLPADPTVLPPGQGIPSAQVVELTDKLAPDGRLTWEVPAGRWTILRLGRTLTGQTSRPAPAPGLGLESGKFEKASLDAHFEAFLGTLLATVGEPQHPGRGLTTVHFDSWEMSSQNWSASFRQEFRARRGYDPARYLPALLGRVVESIEGSERFLWDLRRTAQELVIENHALHLKELGRRHGLTMSIEPYDLNPAGDLALGGAGDLPMGEFWSQGTASFDGFFSCIEAVSIGHTMGRPIVGAESFTSGGDGWRQHPASMKGQGDWALCAGINRIVFHRYQHQPALDRFPGMTFAGYGVHWERTQTWWDLAPGYHTYLARCQAMLRRGQPVADILYLDAEDAPMVFRPPASALTDGLPDRKGYNFDGCAPAALIERASVKDGRIVFQARPAKLGERSGEGMSYRLLVLPRRATMTPELLRKIGELVKAGARVLGVPPVKSPSLSGHPACDEQVSRMADDIWRAPNAMRDALTAVPSSDTPLTGARWIWVNEGNPIAAAPVAQRYLRRSFMATGQVARATFTGTADNSFQVLVNGRVIGGGDNFHQQFTLDATVAIRAGTNLLEVAAWNSGEAPNPAGLIGVLALEFRDGSRLDVPTDRQWTGSARPGEPGAPVADLAAWNAGPWHLGSAPAAFDLYPAYEATAQILADLGVPPDFESAGDLRYIHRREEAADLYFVGNRTAAPIAADCTFRVAGLQPELWDPVTGQRRPLPEHRVVGGRTVVPLEFAPGQSYFIVFRAGPPATGRNFTAWTQERTIGGPWAVTFDPKRGGPGSPVVFDALQDWTARPEDGIKYYSGVAVYRASFDAPAGDVPPGRLALDLGEVHNLASVTLNGRDLGIAWCAPWQVPVPGDAVKPAGNLLEIRVANLWPNRLIRDAGLPGKDRITHTTWSPYKPGSPLLPSGLLGPVTLRSAVVKETP